MMPQFDTFSFFSQLFWVFLGFIFLYLILSLYLLPSIFSTLKVRKHKLAQINTSSSLILDQGNQQNVVSASANNFLLELTNYSSTRINITDSSSMPFIPALVSFFVKIESFRELKFSVFYQTLTTVLLSK